MSLINQETGHPPKFQEELNQRLSEMEYQYENTKLQQALDNTVTHCEELIAKFISEQQQERQKIQNYLVSWNKNLEKKLETLQTANQVLSKNIKAVMEENCNHIQKSVNISVGNRIDNFQKTLEKINQETTDNTRKYYQQARNELMNFSNDFEVAKDKFFDFGSIQAKFFWVGISSGIVNLFLVIGYFIGAYVLK